MAMPLMDGPGLMTPTAWSGDRETSSRGPRMYPMCAMLTLTWCGFGASSPPPRRRRVEPLAATSVSRDGDDSVRRVDPSAAESRSVEPVH